MQDSLSPTANRLYFQKHVRLPQIVSALGYNAVGGGGSHPKGNVFAEKTRSSKIYVRKKAIHTVYGQPWATKGSNCDIPKGF